MENAYIACMPLELAFAIYHVEGPGPGYVSKTKPVRCVSLEVSNEQRNHHDTVLFP